MRMVRWMCGVKSQDRVPSKELRGRLELEDIISVLQQNRLQLYRHLLQKEDNDWVKWFQSPNCQARKLNKENAMDCSRWRKLIKDG